MAKTLAQYISYVRAKVGENDIQRVFPALLIADINHAVQRVQQDLIPFTKAFEKVVYNDGNVFLAPSDILSTKDSISALYASAGVKSAGGTISSSGGTITITAIEPSSFWNGWVISFTNSGTLGTPVINFTDKTISLTYNDGTTTNQDAVDAFNNYYPFSKRFVASCGSCSETMVDPITDIDTAGGSGSRWKLARDMNSKEVGTVVGDFYQEPTVENSNPAFYRGGNIDGVQEIELLPIEISYSKLYYHYRLPEMSSDSDTSGIPIEYDELVLLYSVARTYETLRRMEESDIAKVEYAKKRDDYEKLYQKSLEIKTLEGRSKQSSDQMS